MPQRNTFDFHNKKVAFALNSSIIDKQQYFKNWGGKDVANQLIILRDKEKKNSGFDVIIVSWRKRNISNSFRKQLIKQLS